MALELNTKIAMSYRDNLVQALHGVFDRLALHTEYEKYLDKNENTKDAYVICVAETVLNSISQGIGVQDNDIALALRNAYERLALHATFHQYDDETENVADIDALVDAGSILN